jgi:hypothetical protein
MNCSNCGGSIGESPAVQQRDGQRHYSPLDCLDVLRIEGNSLKIQNKRLQNTLEKIRDYIESDYPQLSRVKEMAKEALIERKCVCRPMTYQEGLDGNCVKCGLPMDKRNMSAPKGCICGPEGKCDYHAVAVVVEPVQQERLIPCQRCGFFHGPDCANPARK